MQAYLIKSSSVQLCDYLLMATKLGLEPSGRRLHFDGIRALDGVYTFPDPRDFVEYDSSFSPAGFLFIRTAATGQVRAYVVSNVVLAHLETVLRDDLNYALGMYLRLARI